MGTEIEKVSAKVAKNSSKRSEKELAEKRRPADKQFLVTHLQEARAKPIPPRIKIEKCAGREVSIKTDGEDSGLEYAKVLASYGTPSDDLLNMLSSSLNNAICEKNEGGYFKESDMNGVLAAMFGIQPHDTIEAMLASQMVATHLASMRAMQQFQNISYHAPKELHGNMAIKLMRTFTAQMEALNRYRGKGQQKMTVEHVHVYEGGKAIVGNVASQPGGSEWG